MQNQVKFFKEKFQMEPVDIRDIDSGSIDATANFRQEEDIATLESDV